MNSTVLAIIIGALVIGLGALGFSTWSGSQSASVPAAMGQGQYYNGSMGPGMMGGNYGPMGPGMMRPMGNMYGYGMGGMHGGMMGQMGMMQGWGMGPWSNYGPMMQNWGCGMGGMHGGMMGNQQYGPGMMGWGCGAPQGPAYAPSQPQQQQPMAVATNSVELKGFAFNPPVIRVPKGTTVSWTNHDTVAHTVTANDGSFNSGLLQPGQSWSFTFDKAGTYSYYCAPHPYMQGQVIVEDAAK